MTLDVQRQGIADALARVVGGCFVMTMPPDADGADAAVLLSFVQQVGFDPPRIAAAIAKRRRVADRLVPPAEFVLNVCADDRALLKRFAATTDGADLYAGLAIKRLPEGVELDGASARMACCVVHRFDAGDHWLVVADVTRGSAEPNRLPYVHMRRNGLSY